MVFKPVTRWWHNLSVTKKLYAVVGLMATLIASELFTLMFAMNTLSAVRAFVHGEGLWTKAQKDAIQSLYQYTQDGQEQFYLDFKNHLEVPAGDHIARMELLKPNRNYDEIRRGFLQGKNHPNDVDGMIKLLVRFHYISYIRDAISAWTDADALLEKLQSTAKEMHQAIQTDGPQAPRVKRLLNEVARINRDLTKYEIAFSSALGAGSRWLEHLLMLILALTVFTVESTGIFLTYRFSRNLSRSLNELKDAAHAVEAGNLAVSAPIHSADELGQLAESLNKMILALQKSEFERRLAVEGLTKLNQDLEERVALRTKELTRREAQLRLITNTLPELVAQVDRNERFLFANDAFCKWFGRTQDNAVGSLFREILGEDRYRENEPYIRKALTGQITNYERNSVSDNGQRVIFNVTYVPEFDEQGVAGFTLVANDVTKYKDIEAELKNAKVSAESANATKSAFLANMSHEIRTPLGVVLGFSELMADEKMSAVDRKNNFEIIRRNGRLLSNIINDILDLSKVEAGKLEIEQMEVSLAEVLNEIEPMLSPEAEAKGVELRVLFSGTVPQAIKTDPLRLRQILLNIVGNAIKFTDKGSVEVTIHLIQAPGRNRQLAFRVKDTGKGVTTDQAARLFSPFSQADASTTRKFGGSGLGLVLSRKLANALGGDVVLEESVPGKGSTFVVTIDPGPSEKVLYQREAGKKAAPSPDAGSTSLAGRRILMVDDGPENQTLVNHYLRGAGAEVEKASNGREGLAKALCDDFHLIVMDLQMPEMDGYEATRELRSRGFSRPILALTAHAMKHERRQCLENGFDEYITKPIDRGLFLSTVSRLLVGRPDFGS